MTVILAVGMQRILKKGGLVRRLASAETLGSTSIIATDKTATLTEGKMKVVEVIGDKSLILKTVVLTSQAFIENPEASVDQWIVRGESTDQALLLAAITAGFNKDELDKHKIAEMPFNPANKLAATVLKEAGRNNLYVCGAPEAVLALSQLTAREGQQWKKKLDQLAGKGLRIVAAGYKTDLNSAIDFKEIINNLTFTGLIALRDPVRPEVKEAINLCRQAGMRPIIITGDHKLTAKAVAEELDWNIGDEDILEGKDLDKLNDDGLDKILTRIQIYARVEPKDKMRIITAWQKRGKVVAMIGDGVNDAPALKKADIGVALGSGTEVAKEAADLILLNDSFAIIVAAVEEGRAILDNIRKVITYLLSDTFSEVVLIGVSILAGVPLPVTAVQIL
ncbi:MAG TPA: HAD-IC family P-type ATPase [Candidatus Woesebacteria bacterium]|nr:HAD-IC family P-type ATPase [Candidatus Woesebacteria bacterium]